MNFVFGERLRNRRIELGITQKYLANKLNISVSAYGYYETGASYPKLESLIVLCKELDISADYLMGLSETKIVKHSGVAETTGLSDDAIIYLNDVLECSKKYISMKNKLNIINTLLEDAEGATLLRQENNIYIFEGNRIDGSEPYYPKPFESKVLEELSNTWQIYDFMSVEQPDNFSSFEEVEEIYNSISKTELTNEQKEEYQKKDKEFQDRKEFLEKDKGKAHLLDKIASYILFNPEHVNLRRGEYSETLSFEHSICLQFGKESIRFPSKESNDLIDYAMIQGVIEALREFKKSYQGKK